MPIVAAILVAGILLGHWPEIILGLSSDPIYWAGHLRGSLPDTVLPGLPGWNDPNAGTTTYALGGLAASQWLRGTLPWWNPYSGVGLPLAAEMQNAAMFLPFVFLLLLRNGVFVLKLAMQLVAGFATYALLRQLGMRRLVATAGALCFALTGTFAWMAHGPMLPVAFLPLTLLGIERSAAASRDRARGGWVWLALGVAYTVLAGFPETALLQALLAACWAGLRLAQAVPAARLALLRKLVAGGAVGLLLAAPAALPFLAALPASSAGVHDPGSVAVVLPARELPLFLTPYAYGPIAFAGHWLESGLMGGFLQLGLLTLALFGLFAGRRERGLCWMIAVWCLVMFADVLGAPAVGTVLNLIPFFGRTIVARYVWPTWELGVVVLAAFGFEAWLDGALRGRHAALAAVLAAAAAVAVGLGCGGAYIRQLLAGVPGYPPYLLGSVAWAVAVLALLAALLTRAPSRRRGIVLGAVLAVEAIGLFSFPLLSGVRRGALDWAAVHFLQQRIGLARFATLGPIAPNYGARLGLASVNEDYLPVLTVWRDYVERHLFPGAGLAFTAYGPEGADLASVLPERLAAYEAVGVKFVLAFRGTEPFRNLAEPPPLVFEGSDIDVYELAAPAPYFSLAAGACTLAPRGRRVVDADCAAPARLLRRELFAPGWTARIGPMRVPIARDQEIFQSVALPAGRSRVAFAYAPPGIAWAWGAFALGLAGLGAGLIGGRRGPAPPRPGREPNLSGQTE